MSQISRKTVSVPTNPGSGVYLTQVSLRNTRLQLKVVCPETTVTTSLLGSAKESQSVNGESGSVQVAKVSGVNGGRFWAVIFCEKTFMNRIEQNKRLKLNSLDKKAYTFSEK